jgi:lipid-binding SYLF domain-containing protein
MKRLLLLLLGIGLTMGTVGNAFADDAKGDLKDASKALKNFTSMPERQIPPEVLRRAKGIAVFHIVDVAVFASGKGGSGVVAARTNNGWSGPVFVSLGGAGIGAQLGAKVKDLVLVLNNEKAVNAIAKGGVKLGANLSTAAGPANASAEAQTTFSTVDIYSYAAGTGVFAGASVQGSVITTDDSENQKFYGKKVAASDILSGKVQAPAGASHFENVLAEVGHGATQPEKKTAQNNPTQQ